MHAPQAILDAIATTCGTFRHATRLSGGDTDQVYRVDTASGIVVAKLKSGGSDAADAEVADLSLIQSCDAIRVPTVLGTVGETIVMEYIAPAAGELNGVVLGERLAALHMTAAPTSQHGLGRSNYLGAVPVQQDWRDTWPEYFMDVRLVPIAEACVRAGHLRDHLLLRLNRLIERVPEILSGCDDKPSLVHGDLWHGNVLAAEYGGAALVDPAVSYGCREMDLAFLDLFQALPAGFSEAYASAAPLPAGWSYRRSLHQLYYLLVHLAVFGTPYINRVDECIAFYEA